MGKKRRNDDINWANVWNLKNMGQIPNVKIGRAHV